MTTPAILFTSAISCSPSCDCDGIDAFMEHLLGVYETYDEWLPDLLWRIHCEGMFSPGLCVGFAGHFETAIWEAKSGGATNAAVVENLAAHIAAWSDGNCAADHGSDESKKFDPRTHFALRLTTDKEWRRGDWGAKYSIELVSIDEQLVEHGHGYCPIEVAEDAIANVIEQEFDWFDYGRMLRTETVVWLYHLDLLDGEVVFEDWAKTFEAKGWKMG